jgi:hypothetical protein
VVVAFKLAAAAAAGGCGGELRTEAAELQIPTPSESESPGGRRET